MDLNGDGHVDLLSGSYSRPGFDMAGLFQVLWGGERGFAEATPLFGSDGEALIIARGQGDDERVRICTRPSACDLNGDGHLDLLAGNFEGTFHVFWGEEGHTFAPQSEPLSGDEGLLDLGFHSDPCPVDWDGDGDLDFISGSESGRVVLALNSGTPTEPRFARLETLIPALPDFGPDSELRFGDGHLTRPRGSTRVSVADVNGDGVHDLLVGDTGEVSYLLEGKTAEETRAAYAAWRVRRDALMEERPQWDGSEGVEERQAAWQERFNALFAELSGIVDKSSRGMVYLYLGSLEEEGTQGRGSSSAP
ncbi:MAG: FG-GAP repeat domain-containing protein [Planctomycetota bacterium]